MRVEVPTWLKFLFVLGLVSAVGCSGAATNVSNSDAGYQGRAGGVETNSFAGQTAKIKSEKFPIFLTADLEDSVRRQPSTQIWLEFVDPNEKVYRTELPDEVKALLDARWQEELFSDYTLGSSADNKYKAKVLLHARETSEDLMRTLFKTEIESPNGNRMLTAAEVFDIFDRQNESTRESYEQINDHFHPKS